MKSYCSKAAYLASFTLLACVALSDSSFAQEWTENGVPCHMDVNEVTVCPNPMPTNPSYSPGGSPVPTGPTGMISTGPNAGLPPIFPPGGGLSPTQQIPGYDFPRNWDMDLSLGWCTFMCYYHPFSPTSWNLFHCQGNSPYSEDCRREVARCREIFWMGTPSDTMSCM